MGERLKVARLSDLTPGRGHCVKIESGERSWNLALFNVEGKFYAIDNTCPHRGGDLAEGDLDGFTVYCPLHAWMFDVRTGASPTISHAKVPSYPVTVEGDDLFIDAG